MEVKELERLKEKIDRAKEDKAKAEGSIEQIEKQWDEEFDCKSPDEVKAKIKETEEEIEKLKGKRDGYIEEIKEVMEV